MTRWKIDSHSLDEREKDFTAQFTCTNVETGATVDLTVRQDKGNPSSDLVGALRVLAQLFVSVSQGETPADSKQMLN